MTEAEWLAAESPVVMLHHLKADGYARKPLLYAAALLELRPDLSTPQLRIWQRAVEDVLAGRRPARALDFFQTSIEFEFAQLVIRSRPHREDWAYYSAIADVVFCTWTTSPYEQDETTIENRLVRVRNAALVREIFGNPFRSVSFSPEWRTSTALAIAQGICESRDYSAMPILADALQDAGCEDDNILSHCRGPGPHVRGCWVCDLVLGKE